VWIEHATVKASLSVVSERDNPDRNVGRD